jgi:hypothetical protein
MDPRFRFDDATEVLESLADDIQSRIRTAIPVTPTEDSDGHTISLQPLTKLTRRKADGSLERTALPVLSDVPINHHGGGGITVTHPHKKGDEGVILVADRAIDAWHQNGGEQGAVDARMHSLSDGVYIPGIRSDPRKLKGVSTTSTQTRTDDKKSLHDISHTAITTIREEAAHQVNGKAIQSQKGSTTHTIDGTAIQQLAKKFLHNCGLG